MRFVPFFLGASQRFPSPSPPRIAPRQREFPRVTNRPHSAEFPTMEVQLPTNSPSQSPPSPHWAPFIFFPLWLLFAFIGQSHATEVTSPPAELHLPPFFQKYLSAKGLPIISSAKVNDYALKETAYLADLMLSQREDIRQAMIANGSQIIVIGHAEFTTDIPNYAAMKPKDFWDARARGLGGSETDPVCACAEENILAMPGDPYAAENIFIHEFAHNIHLRGLLKLDPTFDDRLKKTYNDALAKGLWKGKYAATNHHEYFAEGVQSWFNNNRVNDHDHNHVHLRSQLIEYDPGLAAICREVFGTTELEYTKPTTRLTDHLAGYDPTTAPTFIWPDRLKASIAEIKRKAVERNQLANPIPPPNSTPSTIPAPPTQTPKPQ